MENNIQINFQKGINLIKHKHFKSALQIFLDLKKKIPQNSNVIFNLALIYGELNLFSKSIVCYENYLKKNPNSLNALYNLAGIKQFSGQTNSAKKIYLRLKKLDKDSIKPYYGLYTLDPDYLNEDDYKNILEIKNKKLIPQFDNGLVDFLLSKKEKKNKNYENEIELLKNFHLNIFNSNFQYNTSSKFYYKKIISKHYCKINFSKDNVNTRFKTEISPIFIVGLPRSGSTLVESILKSCEENLISFGECNVINVSVLEQISKKIYNKNFNNKNFKFVIDKIQFKNTVLQKYSQICLDENFNNKKFIDKSLENIFNIEIILSVFPNSKFLYTNRNIIDLIFSIYQSMLPDLAWTHSIEDILDYIDISLNAMLHFKRKYPNNIKEIKLEKFTSSSENLTKEIYNFCGLSWSDKSLQFYKRKDLFSKTLSFNQIRNPVQHYNYKKYKPYYHLIDDYKKKYIWLKQLN